MNKGVCFGYQGMNILGFMLLLWAHLAATAKAGQN